jgi:hypothetical protein
MGDTGPNFGIFFTLAIIPESNSDKEGRKQGYKAFCSRRRTSTAVPKPKWRLPIAVLTPNSEGRLGG